MIFSKKVEHFIVISELGSFKAAAERIHVTPPALSKSIGDLENSLGYRLFNRSNSGINLTKEGDFFYRQLLPVRENLENITKLITKNTKFFRELKIGTDTYNDSFYKIIFSDSIKKVSTFSACNIPTPSSKISCYLKRSTFSSPPPQNTSILWNASPVFPSRTTAVH